MVVYLPFVVGVCVVYIDVWVVLFDLVRLLYTLMYFFSIDIVHKYILVFLSKVYNSVQYWTLTWRTQ